MIENIRWAVETLRGGWYHPGVPWLGAIGIGVAGVTALGPVLGGEIALSASSIASLAFVGVWLWTARLPVASKGKVGLIVALTAEHAEERGQMRRDFLKPFKKLVTKAAHPGHFQVLEYNPRQAERVEDAEARLGALQESRAAFIVSGSVRRRALKGREVHVLDIAATLRHRHLPEESRKRLFGDFGQMLPQRMVLDVDSAFLSFELSAAWLATAAQYYVALAAMLVADFEYSLALLDEVDAAMPHLSQTGFPLAKKLRSRLPQARVTVLKEWLNLLGRRFFLTHDERVLTDAEGVAKRLHAIKPNQYDANLIRAIAAFFLRRDVATARQTIMRCSGHPDSTWKYSRAFLTMYEGDLVRGKSQYLDALNSPGRSGQVVYLEVEEFINIVLESEPDRIGLRLALGLVNYHGKEDWTAAERDLTDFIAAASPAVPDRVLAYAERIRDEARSKAKTTSEAAI